MYSNAQHRWELCGFGSCWFISSFLFLFFDFFDRLCIRWFQWYFHLAFVWMRARTFTIHLRTQINRIIDSEHFFFPRTERNSLFTVLHTHIGPYVLHQMKKCSSFSNKINKYAQRNEKRVSLFYFFFSFRLKIVWAENVSDLFGVDGGAYCRKKKQRSATM